jgi:hypothetical protein
MRSPCCLSVCLSFCPPSANFFYKAYEIALSLCLIFVSAWPDFLFLFPVRFVSNECLLLVLTRIYCSIMSRIYEPIV